MFMLQVLRVVHVFFGTINRALLYIQSFPNQWQVVVTNFGMSFTVLNIYGPISTCDDKTELLDSYSQTISNIQDDKFIVPGDFNGILFQDEKIEGIFPLFIK